VVAERYIQPQPIPKGQNLTQRTMEHFHFWGAEKALRAARTIPPEYGIGGLTAYGTLLGPYFYDWLQRDLVKAYYFAKNERLPQYATEAVMRQRVSELPAVATLYGWSAASVAQDAQGVTVTLTERSDGAQRTVRAAYVVGCDGSRSVVREQVGLTQTLSDHDRMMVLLVFRSRALHDLLARYPGKSYYNVLHPQLEGYWKFLGRVDLGNTWFMHAPVPVGTTADNYDFKGFLHDAVGATFEVEFDHIGFWDLRFAVADSYQKGRAFIAGDAAHSHPPYGGYGVNSGLEDARNLGWKIAATLQGWGGERLLASYDAERRPVFRSTVDDFIAKSIENDKQFLAACDPAVDKEKFESAWEQRAKGAIGEVNAFEPHYAGSPIVSSGHASPQPCSSVGSHQFDARAGHHLAPALLSSGKNVLESLGAGYTLLALGEGLLEPDISRFEAAANKRGLPLTIIREAGTEETQRYQARWVLVRPDHFVAWVAHDAVLSAAVAEEVLAVVSGAND